MPEIEFIQTQPRGFDEPGPGLRDQGAKPTAVASQTLLSAIPAVLALGAAALAAWAPFHSIYEIREPQTDDGFADSTSHGIHLLLHIRFDGWGRVLVTPRGANAVGQHGVNYGIVAAAGGGLFVVAALILVARLVWVRGDWAPRLSAIAGALLVAGAATSAAFGGTVYLAFRQIHDQIRALQSTSEGSLPSGFHLTVGWCWAMAAGACVVGLSAVLASVLTARHGWEQPDLEVSVSQPPPSLQAYGLGIHPVGDPS